MGASQAGCLVVLLPPPHTAKACRASPLTLSAPPLPRRSSTWWWCGTAPSPSCCRTSTLAPSSWAGASTWTASTCLASWGEGPKQPCSEAGEAQKLWRGQAAGDQPPMRTEARLPPWGCTIGPLPNCRCFMATYFSCLKPAIPQAFFSYAPSTLQFAITTTCLYGTPGFPGKSPSLQSKTPFSRDIATPLKDGVTPPIHPPEHHPCALMLSFSH